MVEETIRHFTLNEKRNIFDGSSERHIRDTMSKLDKFFDFERYGHRYLTDFKGRDINRFLNFLEDDLGLSKGTCNRYASAISLVFKHAVKEEVIPHAPKFNWKKEKGGRIRFFTAEEITKIYWLFKNSRKQWMVDMFTVGLHTGMRLGEILQAGDTAFISQCQKYYYLPKTKNGSDRKVPLNKSSLEALQRLGKVKDKYKEKQFYALWREAKKRIGKGKDDPFVFHVSRHTCATKMANEMKVNTLIIGSILGHKSQSTTARYVHADIDNLCDIANQLDEAM